MCKWNRDCFHHGDLRQVLIDLALNAVRTSGANAFSLREAAKLAGVTPGAAYRHFASREALLAEVKLLGFALLGKHMICAMIGLDPKKRFAALGLAYVSFATKEPHLFALLFGPRANGPTSNPVEASPDDAYALLRQCIAEFQGIAGQEVDPADLAMAWASAHGAARLVVEGVWHPNDPRITLAINRSVEALAPSFTVESKQQVAR
jgi:AcrR family transcriptional regulator